MEFALERDPAGHVTCSIGDMDQSTTVTASNGADAMAELMAALEAARNDGSSECLWPEATGEYRWMFRRSGDRLTVVVLWSHGTLTGWQHVFRSECDGETFEQRVRSEWRRVGAR